MTRRQNGFARPITSIIAIGIATSNIASAHAQGVADNTLSDVKVSQVGACSTVTINFNVRVQVLSSFPAESGQEVHVRIRPLDAGSMGLQRESLRPPSSVPAIRSIEYEGENPSGPVLSLFFTHDMKFNVKAGADPQSIILELSEIGGSACESVARTDLPSPAFGVEIPEGLYVVNLTSSPDQLVSLTPGQQSALSGKVLYETLLDRDARQWHRLRAGFFASRSEAEEAKAKLSALFPDSFVVKVSANERAQGVINRLDSGSSLPDTGAERPAATSEQAAEAAQLVSDAEIAIADGNNDRAIQLLTNALQLPESEQTPRALELLGLTRERKGQAAHAQAEYEEYLRRYPTGEAADRVQQRLVALTGVSGSAGPLRAASGDLATGGAWNWGVRGSFSQFYFRDQSTTKFVDASRPDLDPDVDNSVNLNQLLTTADVTISGGNDQTEIQARAAGAYTFNFRSGGRDIESLTALYLDYSDDPSNVRIRLGRQTRNSAGVLGRFDGVLLSWQAKPKIRLNLVEGFPVLTSRQTHVLKERPFYGASVDFGEKRGKLQGTLYWFDQRSKGGFIDRQSVGAEARVLLKRFNAFTLIDYDVKYKELNLGLVTLNYNFPDTSNLSVTADYRKSPLLTTNNALIGQIFSATLLPVQDLQGLRQFFTEEEVYQLARDRTLTTKSVTASYSRPLTKKLQTNFDFTVTHTGGTPGTPASTGTLEVFPLPASGTEYYYGAQLVGTGLLWENDIFILSGRYADTQRNRTYTADFNARVPISSKFRLSPRVRYGYRDGKITPQTPIPGTFRQFQPTLRMNYYPSRRSELEFEVGGNFTRQKDNFGGTPTTLRESGILINAGCRIDF